MESANQMCDDTPKLFRIYTEYDVYGISLHSWNSHLSHGNIQLDINKSQSYLLYVVCYGPVFIQ